MSGQNEVNWAEIVAAKVFYKSIRAPGKRVSPDHFQATLRMLWLLIEQKNPLYYFAQSANSNFRVTFVCSYTAVYFSLH